MSKKRKPTALWARIGIYAFLGAAAVFFLLPLYVMLTTSFKTMDEIRLGQIFALPSSVTFDAWRAAWSEACTGVSCEGVRGGFWNSVTIAVPSVVLPILLGAINGYALSWWKPKGGEWLFGLLMMGAFIPIQVMIYPLVKLEAAIGIYSSLPGIVVVHLVFAMPIMTLLFRNYYAGLPAELFKAARVDGGGFWRIFVQLVLPMSTPMLIVAAIMQITGVWNDYILGLTFAGRENQPMTVQLNNVINTTTGERLYNLNMAATILTSAVPLLVYLISGRWFVRGIAAGAVK
ncbi:carbohydrate ABC transporter permease [Roseateles asaccharophilus]|uniref:Glucose/mannose transport system permease protein n=1 Tax=Roseateles asaccharophilus TaxID=582607 RepID=A0ABU2ADF2_9BURK|nr:carbohydrate ABC transporter permease [Roseateles asaccharophilus]MDR7335219.1 glucose/mannose transport system permease protein [Roseateles asaccharophilus]